jgi:hypothetical protein
MQMSAENDDSLLILKGYLNACEALGLSKVQAFNLIGLSSNKSNVSSGKDLGFDSKQTEFQVLFISMYRALFGLFGGDKKAIRHWFENHNKHIHGVPKDLCLTVGGLINVNTYLNGVGGTT